MLTLLRNSEPLAFLLISSTLNKCLVTVWFIYNVLYLQPFDHSWICLPPVPLSLNNSIARFLSLFWSLKSSSVFFSALTKSSFFCVMFFFFYFFVFFVGILCLARASPVAVFSRSRSVSESESSFSLPSSFSAPTFLKSIYQGSLGSLADSGSLKRWEGVLRQTLTPTPIHLDPNVPARDRGDGWDLLLFFCCCFFLLGWQETRTCCLSKPFNTQLFVLLSVATLLLVKILSSIFFLLSTLQLHSPSSCFAQK